MVRCFCLVWLAIAGLIGSAFGAIFPPSADLSTSTNFPCYEYQMPSDQAATGSPLSIKVAKNEHYLFILKVTGLSMSNGVRAELRRSGKAAAAWLDYDVFQLRAVPDTLTDEFYADGLVPLDSGLTASADPIYLAVRLTTTEAHPAGTFFYELSISEGAGSLLIPLKIGVWPFCLPVDLDLTIEGTSQYMPSWYSRYNNTSLLQVFPSYLEAFREYKINATSGIHSFDANDFATNDKKIDTNYTVLASKIMDVYDKYGFQYFRIPAMTVNSSTGTSGDIDISYFKMNAPKYYAKWYDFMQLKGYSSRVLVKIWDEPTDDEIPYIVDAYSIVKEHAPNFKTELTGSAATSEMNGTIDCFVYNCVFPGNRTFSYEAATDSLLRNNIDSWMYANTLHSIKFPPSSQRIIGWELHHYNFSGYLLWCLNYFVKDPWTSIPSDGSGTDLYRRGTFFYPHPDKGTPLPTLRLEALRRGFGDYLYLYLLKKARKTVPASDWNGIEAKIAELTPRSPWSDFETIRTSIGEVLSGKADPGGHHGAFWAGSRVLDLGTLDEGGESWANAINNYDSPLVAGAATNGTSGPMRAFVWQNGTIKEMEPLMGDLWSSANDLNDSGLIVGDSGAVNANGTATIRACLWTWRNGEISDPTELVGLGGRNSYANAINNLGQIVGESQNGTGVYHAVLWDNDGTIDIGKFTPLSINDSTRVVGRASDGSAVFWKPGNDSSLEDGNRTELGKPDTDYYEMSANAVAASGQIVGFGKASTYGRHKARPLLSDAEGAMSDVGNGTVAGGLNGYAWKVDSSGESLKIAGYTTARYPERQQRAFFANGTASGSLISTDLGPGAAFGVNARGEIAGYAGLPSLSINSGAQVTDSTAVSLTISADSWGFTRMRINQAACDSGSWAGVEWQDYSTGPFDCVVSSGAGLKTVEVQLGDSSGHVHTARASILLDPDTDVPSGTIVINNGAGAAGGSVASVTLSNVSDSSWIDSVFLSNAGGSSAAVPFPPRGAITWDLNAGLNSTADGLRTVSATLKDAAGHSGPTTSASIILDTTVPTVSLSSTAASPTNISPIPVTIAFSEPVNGFEKTDLAVENGTVADFSGSGASYVVNVIPEADGVVTVSVPAGVATDHVGLGNSAGEPLVITYDATLPTVSIGEPSTSLTQAGPVSFVMNYTGADTITLSPSDITPNTGGTVAWGSVIVSGTDNLTRTVTISNITGDGSLGISIGKGTATDNAGNSAPAAGPSAPVTVDNTAPAISIGAPSVNLSRTDPVSFVVSYAGADTITLSPSDITPNTGGTVAWGSVIVSGTDNLTRTVTISDITGDGSLGISIGKGTATDNAGNSAPAAGPSAPVTVDNTAPAISIGVPSVNVTKIGPVNYGVTYNGAAKIVTAASYAADYVTLHKTGTTDGKVTVSGTGMNRTVKISKITGEGTFGISIKAGTAFDKAGNSAPAAGPSKTFTVVRSLTVVSPNGGETWAPGSTQTIRWSYGGNPGTSVNIDLLSKGKEVLRIASAVKASAKSYKWTIPKKQAKGKNYRIRITSTTFGNCTDTSDKAFTIGSVGLSSSAGPDQKVAESARVILNGANSLGGSEGVASYRWTQVSGPPVALIDRNSVVASFTAPETGAEGKSMSFQLTVTDKDGSQSVDTCVVNVTQLNEPPKARAGPNQTAAAEEVVALDGSGSSDADDGIASYLWEQVAGDPVELSDATAARPSFGAPRVGETGQSLVFRLTVTDRGGLISRDTCMVNVKWMNDPPTAEAGASQVIEPGEKVSLDGGASRDEGGGVVSYRWIQKTGVPVTLSDPTAMKPTFTAPAADTVTEKLLFELTVTDAGGLSNRDRVAVTIDGKSRGH